MVRLVDVVAVHPPDLPEGGKADRKHAFRHPKRVGRRAGAVKKSAAAVSVTDDMSGPCTLSGFRTLPNQRRWRRTEQRQGLRKEVSHPCAEPRRGGGGRIGTHLPALALRGGGRRRVVRPPPGPGLGAPGRRGRGGAGSRIVRHPVPGLQRQALSREAGRLPWRPAQLQLGPVDLAGPWPRASRSAAPTGASARGGRCPALHQDGSRHEWVSGRQWASPWTTPPARSPRPSSSPRKAPFPGASRGGRRARAVLLALHRQPLLPHARGRRQGRQGQPDPGRARPSPASSTSPPTRPRPAGARSGCSAPCRNACPKNSGSPASPTWPRSTASSSRSTCRATTGASPPRPRGSAFVPFAGTLDDILCVHEDRLERHAVQGTHPADPGRPPPLRQGQGPGPRVPRPHPCRLPRPRTPRSLPGRRGSDRNPEGRVTRFDAIFRRRGQPLRA